jgi:hypothetical protein
VQVVQEDIAAMIPLESCYLVWRKSFVLLVLLVEPDIPG